jgi:hypothetical protein
MDAFISEHNVDIYLSKLWQSDDTKLQDTLLQLLMAELSRMPLSRLHLERGLRRRADVEEQFRQQRDKLDRLKANGEAIDREARLLEVLGKVRELFEAHCLRQAGGQCQSPAQGGGESTVGAARSPRGRAP